MRDDIPPLPADIDNRVLSAVRREQDSQPAARRAVRHNRRFGVWLAVCASVPFLVLLAFLPTGQVPEPDQAVASIVLTSRCDTASGHTYVKARKSVGGEQRDRQPIVVAGPWAGPEATSFLKVLERFNERTGIPVVYAYQTREIAKTVRTRVSRGCPPDVALLPQPGLLRILVEGGHLKPIDPSTQRLVRRNLGSFWYRQGTVNNKLYGVWFKAANKSTFWYSRRVFAAAGLAEPTTWAELRNTAAKLHARGTAPFSVAGGDGWTLTDWFENVYLRTAGPERYDDLAEHRIAWTDETVRVALKRLSEILRRPQWLAGGRSAMVTKTDFEQSVDQVFSARPSAAMVYEGDFVANQMTAAQAADAGVFSFPAIAGSKPSVMVGGDVATLFTGKRDAQRLVRFLATVKAAQLWARSGGISPNRRLDPSFYLNRTTRRLAQSLINAKTTRFDLSDLQPPAFGATPGQGMPKILQDYLSGAVGIDTAAQKLEAAASATRACERALAGEC